jgi:hypothetical protein
MTPSESLDALLTERNIALIRLDTEWARKQKPGMERWTKSQLLLTLHKARHQCTAIPASLRIESARWLKDNGWVDMFGQPIDDPERLPE